MTDHDALVGQIETILFRRLMDHQLEGYTLATANEIAGVKAITAEAAEIERLKLLVNNAVLEGSDADWRATDAEKEIERLRVALKKISCRSQSEDLLWWQKAARAALKEHKP